MNGDLSERAFVGALFHLPAARVIAVAARVKALDLLDPRLRIVYTATVQVAATGNDPDPARVHGHARTSGLVRAADLPTFTGLVVDLHTGVPIPAAVESYARSVIEAAVRRRVDEAAVRLERAANDAPLDVLATVIRDESGAIGQAIARLAAVPLAVSA